MESAKTAPEARLPNEFRAGWPTLVGTTAAVSTGAALFNYTASFFVKPIQDDFGWSRAEIGFGSTITMLTAALLLPVMGLLTDRFGPVRVGGAGLAGFGLMCMVLASVPAELPVYYAVLFALAIAFAASSAVTFAPLVAARFKRRRGFALGIMMSGPAILMIPIAPLLSTLIADSGWRAGYVAIAIGALIIGLPGLFLAARGSGAIERKAQRESTGMDLPQVLRTATYWKLSVGALLSTIALGGFLHQYAALFADQGFEATEIGFLGSVFVGMILIGRTGVGYLLDQRNPPVVAMVAMLGAATGALFLLLPDTTFVTAAISLALIGCAFGAEGDIHAFFTAREFGLKSFATIFATLAMMAAAGFGIGALLFGRLYDVNNNYDVAIYAAAAMLGAAALLFGSLPRREPVLRGPALAA